MTERTDNKVAPQATLDNLQVLHPLQGLLPDHLAVLYAEMEQRWFFSGDQLVLEGQYDNHVMFLFYGTVECRFSDDNCVVLDAYQQLRPLADQQPRPCTLVATSDCSVLIFNRERLDKLLTWSQVSEYMIAELACDKDLDEDARWMDTILRSNLFLKVPPTNMGRIFKNIESQTVFNGEVIIRQGELGDCCYFIKEGTARVSRRQSELHNSTALLANVGPGRCFGEDALVKETVRNASVTMTSDGVLMRLNKGDFLELLKDARVPSFHWENWLNLGADMLVVDVRTEAEYSIGHLQGAINVPLTLLSVKRRLLPAEKTLVLYCDSGRRSSAAAYLLIQQGIGALCLKGGITAIPAAELSKRFTRQDFYLKDREVRAGQSSSTRI